GALAAGRSVANDIVSSTRSSGSGVATTGGGTSASAPGAASNVGAVGADEVREASSPARDTELPGSGEEKL
ncbi:MAG TPA: hypothetical protein VJU87_08880, partial [Gemmatimonadaceae bacterium]|nr:hypothetical protein [Gemmatimonadaceae bacterium]